MTLLKIITIPDSRLKTKSNKIDNFDENLKKDIKNMYETLYASENGIGLAAPQVGLMKRLIVIDLKEEDKSEPLTLVNPKILNKSDEKFVNQEGCLSIPGYYADIERSQKIECEYNDANGSKRTMTAQGLLSICIQHEVDHLNGVLFIDYLSKLKRKIALEKVTKAKNKN